MARVKLRCIMECPGLKSSYQEKIPLEANAEFSNNLTANICLLLVI